MSGQARRIAVLGGTGALGRGLSGRLVAAGHSVTIGSREEARAGKAARELAAVLEPRGIAAGALSGAENVAAAQGCELAILTVPFAHQAETLRSVAAALEGKILVDATVPLRPPKVARVQLPPEGSAGQAAQALLGEGVRVVSAFQNVAAAHLLGEGAIDCDVLVTGNDQVARAEIAELLTGMGLTGIDAGPIANAAAAEALTSVLIHVNRRHKVHAGIRISGLGGTS